MENEIVKWQNLDLVRFMRSMFQLTHCVLAAMTCNLQNNMTLSNGYMYKFAGIKFCDFQAIAQIREIREINPTRTLSVLQYSKCVLQYLFIKHNNF